MSPSSMRYCLLSLINAYQKSITSLKHRVFYKIEKKNTTALETRLRNKINEFKKKKYKIAKFARPLELQID